jgi:hypothetical protein
VDAGAGAVRTAGLAGRNVSMVARDMVSNPWSVAGVAVSSVTADRLAEGVSVCRGAVALPDRQAAGEFSEELGGRCL